MKRSKFSLSHYKLLTCDMGELVPISCFEVLPGDTVQQLSSLLLRVSPLLSPVMHPVRVRIHHWFVPNRLVWNQWEDFITGGPNGDSVPTPPYKSTSVAEGSLLDYLGLPIGPVTLANAMPIRAYNLIWNEWYRDQDLQAEIPISLDGGADSGSDALQHVSWEKDYFTTSRPWTQKGPEVTIPLGDVAPVRPVSSTSQAFKLRTRGVATTPENIVIDAGGTYANVLHSNGTAPPADNTPTYWPDQGNLGLEADLSSATATSINDLRRAFAIQRYEEARARYGSRYTEYLRYLGVRSSDARLQRPEYLGGGKQTIQFSEVLQTGPDVDDTGVANLKGHGIAAARSNRYRRFFEEHGFVISLLSVLPRTMYTQGMSKMWYRPTKEDYFQKELQHIGQQEVLNKEIYAASAQPEGVFGYQDRYDEYRRISSTISGEFRNQLDFWHYGRIFASAPALNADFVKAVPTKRVNAVQSNDCLWIMANHSIQARRLVSGSAKSFIF